MKKPLPDENHAPQTHCPAATAMPSRWPVIDSANLLRGSSQVFITHGGCIYTLRLTRGDKLILTK